MCNMYYYFLINISGITSIKQPLPASVVNISKYKSVPSPFLTMTSSPGNTKSSMVGNLVGTSSNKNSLLGNHALGIFKYI